MEEGEKMFLSNSVGKISNNWIKIKTFKGGQMTIPFEDILSIKYRLKRKVITATIWFIIGALCLWPLFYDPTNGKAYRGLYMTFLLGLGGLANLLGYFEIEIHTVNKIVRLEDVEFNKLKDGRAFIETLEKLILAKN
ncbi:MAG: hypothetical protein ACKVU0_18225 [Saprospiraceae bacterium]